MMARGIEGLQAVWFSRTAPSKPLSELFEALVGQRPDVSQRNPQGQLEVGVRAEWQYRLQSVGSRVDLFMEPVTSGELFPLFADIEAGIALLFRTAEQFAPFAQDLTRLASVMTVTSHFQDPEEAAQATIDAIGGVEHLPKGSRDLMMRVNVRAESHSIPGVEFNRVLTWQVRAVQRVEASGGSRIVAPEYLSTIGLDMNVVPDSARILSPDDQIKLWGDLRAEASRLLKAPSVASLG